MGKKLYHRIISGILALTLVFLLVACDGKESEKVNTSDNKKSSTSSTSDTVDYASKLFDTSYVHTIDIAISDDDWNDLKANPLEKTKYKVNITIDGETIESVSFATKGNTSLTSVASDTDSDRYSFKVNFGKYTKDQTYYGLDKLNLNNIYADATYMKDYLSYEIFRQAGVDSPLVSYVWMTINGEAWGLYLAIEDISEGYLERVDNGEGELYKPETEQLANMGQKGEFNKPGNTAGDIPGDGNWIPQMPGDANWMPQMPGDGNEMPQGGNMGFGGRASGADLAYIDDEINSYSDIFDNDETDADTESNLRVIAALKGLSEGKNLEDYLDTDEIIRFFAAHNFVLNYDSYTGNMLHNYYLYENNGKLSMLPWDYNLAFGGFSGAGNRSGETTNVTSLINTGIDTPLSGATEDSRPMWKFIVSDEKYLEQYHSVYDTLISEYFESGAFETEIDALYEMIYPYVEKDPSAFYTAGEFKTAYETLKQFCLLRAQSIRLQLDGTLQTKSSEQDASKQVDASMINIQSMGTHRNGQGNEGREGFNREGSRRNNMQN